MLTVYFITGVALSGLILAVRDRRLCLALNLLFIIVQSSLAVYAVFARGNTELNYFTFDSLSVIFLIVMAILSAAVFYHSIAYVREDDDWKRKLFFFSFILLNLSLTGVYTANNIIVSWIFIELTTLSAAGLINHNRSMTSLEATWKYVFICSVGIAIAYIGILFAGAASGVGKTGDMSYDGLRIAFQSTDPVYLKIAFILILTGYSSKLEVFPLYTIGVDANYVAPAPVSAFLSTALVNGGFVVFFRVYETMAASAVAGWINNVLVLTGMMSLLVAAIYMQKASNLKRVFAYSTVEHMGLVLIALSFGKTGIYIALIQVTVHSFVKSGLFFHAGILHKVLKSYKLSKAAGYMALNPAGALILMIGVLLITAIPPSGLFISEFMLFREMGSQQWILFIAVATLLTLIFYGIFSKNMHVIAGEPAVSHIRQHKVMQTDYISQYILFGLAVAACLYIPDFITGLFSDVSGTGPIPISILNMK
ncbi:MAG: hydrogenase 4 subunit F [Bacteroidales bacterium]|jgi:hydrogenase-4 component F|nr:hydrogenase 4 subunit F [Bacteroidales bacterium]